MKRRLTHARIVAILKKKIHFGDAFGSANNNSGAVSGHPHCACCELRSIVMEISLCFYFLHTESTSLLDH